MPTIPERLAQIIPKIERAKKHINDVNGEVLGFFETDPYVIATKRDPQGGQLSYYISSIKPVPAIVGLIAGDVIQNLMSALDHLAYQLVCVATGDKPPNPNWIFFPIQDDATKYESKKIGKIQGARPTAIKAIDALKPYKGGNDLLWALYRLNNIDKHRLLITVVSDFRSLDLGAEVSAMTRKFIPGFPDIQMFFGLSGALNVLPLKQGDVLYVSAPHAEVNEKMKFRFDVSLSEPQIIETKPLLELLIQLADLVEGIVSALTSELA